MMTNCTVSLKADARGLNLDPEFRVVNQGIKWGVKSTEYLADKTSLLKYSLNQVYRRSNIPF